MKRLVTVVLLTVATGTTLAQSAAAPADLIKARQQGLKALGSAFKTIRDELKGGAPDAGKIREAGAQIAKAGKAIEGWFPAGTGPGSDVKTDAKPDVWSDPAGFAAACDAFVREAAHSAQVFTGGNDQSAWNAAATALGQTCKGCHDKYRVKRD
jgi:cytochrome c556